MNPTSRRLLVWSPRVLGLLVSLFLGLFALDAFSDGKPIGRAILDFLIHLLPSFALLTIVVASWRREWIGGLAFTVLAVLYATTMARGRIDWMLVVAGLLLVVGLLFLWSWFDRRTLHAA